MTVSQWRHSKGMSSGVNMFECASVVIQRSRNSSDSCLTAQLTRQVRQLGNRKGKERVRVISLINY